MKRILFFLFIIGFCFPLTSCESASSLAPRSNPVIRYFARPGSLYSYRYMKLLYKDQYNPQHFIMKDPTPNMTSASVQVLSSSVKTTRLIDYPTFMDASGFMTTIKKFPIKTAVLDSSLAEIWQLAGGTISATVQETITRGIASKQNVTIIPIKDYKIFDYEFLLSYEPDLVILNADNTNEMKVAQLLRVYNIPVLAMHVDSFLDYLSVLSDFTKILDTPQNYMKYGSKLLDQIEAIQERYAALTSSPKVLLCNAPNIVYPMITDLGAKLILSGSSDNAMDDEISTAPVADVIVDIATLKKASLFSYLPNQRWPEAYEYLALLLYGEITVTDWPERIVTQEVPEKLLRKSTLPDLDVSNLLQ